MRRIVCVGLASLMLFGCGRETREERAERLCLDTSWAWTMAQRYVKERLASPSSASFPYKPVHVERLHGCTHRLTGEVEAKNAFGVQLKKYFSVTITYNKGDDTWSGSDLSM